MKYIMKIFFFLIFVLTINSYSQTVVNGQFVVTNKSGSAYTVKIQINSNTGTNALGTSTLIFNYDTTALSFPRTPVSGTNYTFLNFSGGNYTAATITRPVKNEIWLNIDLQNSNNGTMVTKYPGWIDVATITFNIIGSVDSASLSWQPNNTNWGIFDADNATLWANAVFTNLNTQTLTSFTPSVSQIPNDYTLYQNYPNPFNPSTQIKFGIPKSSLVNIKIFDITGKVVATLINDHKEAGFYSISFNASNLSSGVYFYKITANDFSQVRKMVLLK